MGLEHVRRTYEDFGREDPFFAVLSDRSRRGGKWDPKAFFATGREEIDRALAELRRLGVMPDMGRALDFGCAVGRLTQALARHFDDVVGVDIAQSMLDVAREYNEHGERVTYALNTVPDLERFEGGSFDFVYSNITLQHIPRASAEAYVSEFFRLLRPGGVALFQVPDGPDVPLGSFRERLTSFWRGPVRRFSKRIRGKAPVEIHYVPRPVVEASVRRAGCELVDARDLSDKPRRWTAFRYCVRRPIAP